jgi:Gas vesicle protein G
MMGLFTSLVMLPLAPIEGVIWIARQLEEQASREIYSPESIRRQLDEFQQALDAGEITEEEYLEAENILLDRLDQVLAFAPPEGDL